METTAAMEQTSLKRVATWAAASAATAAEQTPLTRVASWAAASVAAPPPPPPSPQPTRLRRALGAARARARIAILCTLAIALAAFAVLARAPPSRAPSAALRGKAGGADAYGSHGAVAADDDRCSQIGVRVLQELKGNAADAAVAALLCQGAVAPFASGIGGGAFILVRVPNGEAFVYDARETAPELIDADAYEQNPKSSRLAGLAVAVPGELRGLYNMHADHGIANWSSLVMLVVPLVEESVVSRIFVEKTIKNRHAILQSTALRRLLARNASRWADRDPQLLQEGDIYRNPELADTYRAIAKRGPDAFYEHRAAQIADAVHAAGGVLTADDVRSYQVVRRKPIVSDYRGYTILGAPLPSAGGPSIAMALNILEGAALAQRGRGGASYAYITETLKHVFAWRPLLGEPRFTYGARHAVRQMLDKSLARRLQRRIVLGRTFPPSHYSRDLRFSSDDRGTTHISVADAGGMAISATSTINLGFGSGVVAAGVLLNNEMDDFSPSKSANYFGIPPSLANRIKPRKRPLSSMSPTIVLRDGRPLLVVGGSGGPRIITATLQTILNVLDWRDSVHDAVTAPRLHHQLLPNVVHMESINSSCVPISNSSTSADAYYWPGVCRALKSAGHVLDAPSGVGVVQAISIQDEPDGKGGTMTMMYAASDPRKYGKAEAY